jgi:cytochrome c oxidase assembly protein subunit 15
VTTGVIYLQLILGALMRHVGAGLAIPDFPLAFGRLWPPFTSLAVVIHFLHRLGAVAVTLCIGWAVLRVLRQYRTQRQLLRPACVLTGLLVTQLVLGAYTIWTQRAVVPMTAHVAVGAAVLATSLVLTLRTYRLFAGPIGASGRALISEQVTA